MESSKNEALNYGASEDEVLILTHQIEQLEELIDRLDTISPIESFIYTEIINGTAEYLGTIEDTEDAREFDFGGYITKDADLEGLNLSGILENLKQKSYFLEEYQLLQRDHPHRITETIQMREQEDDHISVNLRLAQSLRARSIDPAETHIPEFADLMDEHIAYMRAGITDSKNLSDSEKTERLELLDAMQSKAQAYKDSEQVTYLIWLMFNLQLSMIATSDSDLLNDDNLYLFMLKKREGDIDFEFIKEWIINDDGSDILKMAGLFKLFDHFHKYRSADHKDSNDVIAINRIAADMGLNLNFDDIWKLDLELEDDVLLLNELARGLNLELKPEALYDDWNNDRDVEIEYFYNVSVFGSFIYMLNHFPERMMIPVTHDLEYDDINRTYGTGVQLIGLNNDYMQADSQLMSPFRFIVHDIGHSVNLYPERSFAVGYDNYADLSIQLENLPEPLRLFMQRSYFEFMHEGGLHDAGVTEDLIRLIKRYRQQQRQVVFSFMQRLGNLTASEELEFKIAILLLIYFELPEEYIVFNGETLLPEDIEFTEENIKDTDTFVKLILRLCMLYERQLALARN